MKIIKQKKLLYTSLFLFALMNVFCSTNTLTETKEKSKNTKGDVKVGAWYFGGWSFPPDEEGYTFHISPTLVNEYQEREPLWGWREDDSKIMEDQIDYAANAGLSFWGFCWYENTLVEDPKLMDNLNNALDLFLQAPNSQKLDFLLLSCFPVSPVNWEKLCEKTISLFEQPNYLRVDKKPVMVFFNTEELIKGLGGLEEARKNLEAYREKAREAGVGEILIGARVAPDIINAGYEANYNFCGFDFVTTYHQSDFGRVSEGANDYGSLIEADQKTWERLASNNNMLYLPTLSAGYDMRPWAADHPTVPASDYWFTGVTSERIANHLQGGIEWIQENENKVLGNLFIMYAWNENGEGAWLTPTKANGTDRLDAIKEVLTND